MPTQEVLCSEGSPSMNEPWLLPPEGWGLSRKPLNLSRCSKQEINSAFVPRGGRRTKVPVAFSLNVLVKMLSYAHSAESQVPGRCKTQLRLETVCAGPSLAVPFRLNSWEITCSFIRDFTPPPTLSKLGCSEASRIPSPPTPAPLSEALYWIRRQTRRDCVPPGPDLLSGLMKKHPQLDDGLIHPSP